MKWRQYVVACKKFKLNNGALNASALTFYTMFALVPILAAAIGVARGFGLDTFLNSELEKAFPGQESVVQFLTEYASNLLAQGSKEVIAGVAVTILFYSIYSMLSHIEHAFNKIWQVADPRKIMQRITNYLALVLIAPILLIFAGSLKLLIINLLPNYNLLIVWCSNILSFTLISFVFYWLYKYLPNAYVRPRAAIFAGVHVGIAYFLLQSFLIESQLFITSYNKIYGSLAALPLFLVWVQVSWSLVLLGAQLCFVYQNNVQALWEVDLNNLSIDARQKLLLTITQECVAQRNLKQPPLSVEDIANKIHLPICTAQQLLARLVAANILIPTITNKSNTAYVPAHNNEVITEKYILNATNKLGISMTE